ncbi:hypothetical protein CYA_0715 [Synechococcus sp. JA-3-3Ab]|nr:hypothetical protein CYA_0715 [Synechococcus sp. JA-3-3Ab]
MVIDNKNGLTPTLKGIGPHSHAGIPPQRGEVRRDPKLTEWGMITLGHWRS